uniref:Uncharacterized protein n=1 Tax=Arundo donax TaxID=35708 RepID=A0A0A9HL81_ARUDO
MFSWEERNAGV